MKPLTFSINLETLTTKPIDLALKATPEERAHIAQRLGLISLEHLEAELKAFKKGLYFLIGKISADVTQQCGRTLSPLPSHLEINVNETFRPCGHQSKDDITLDLEDLVEPLESNNLDIGEIVVQLLSLNLDPFPISDSSKPLDYQESASSSSPFSVLKKET